VHQTSSGQLDLEPILALGFRIPQGCIGSSSKDLWRGRLTGQFGFGFS
jgi:hypothetical protein